ncbi:segregation/condensation protein A [Enterococcus sp. HY326]|uniref:segregation/condensation protein A n=1 Tax=Enterococcus sp. HY326 TaxID=2971265 RepID=UPI00223E9321|nr:segregation/condensation protein A [Enterococcus sp. HY326]
MEEIKVKLDVFEGPLDLLLHLIKKFEIDIYDIPIAEVTEQYMHYIHTMKTLELELAGEYIVMAATLMAIKSQMLLPKPELEIDPDEEVEGEDPRDALVAQLLEYRKFKYAAEVLSEKAEERSLYFTKEPTDISSYQEKPNQRPTVQLNTIDLFFAFHQMLEKRRKKQPLETTITSDNISIEEKMAYIETKLKQVPKTGEKFETFFTSFTKADIVTTFMALLELMKGGVIRAEQSGNYSQITLFPIDRSIENE